MILAGNPFYTVDARALARRGSVPRWRLVAYGVLTLALVCTVIAVLPWGARTGFAEILDTGYVTTVVLYEVWLMLSGVSRGFNVVARERVGRRLETLQCSPLTDDETINGLLAVAVRPTLMEALCWGAVLLVTGGLAPWTWRVAVAAVPYGVGIGLVSTLVGLWIGGEDGVAAQRTLEAILLYVAWIIVTCLVASQMQESPLWLAINPIVFVAGLLTWFQPSGPLPLAFAALGESLVCAVLLRLSLKLAWKPFARQPPPEVAVAPGPSDMVAGRPVKFAKSTGFRNPYLAVAVDRYLRSMSTLYPAITVAMAAFSGHAWSLGTAGRLAFEPEACLLPLIGFGLCGLCSANTLVAREREPHRLEMLLTTGLSTSALMYGQWLASLVPLVLPVLVFALFSGAVVIPGLAATLGGLLGAAIGMAICYRIRFAPWVYCMALAIIAALVAGAVGLHR